MDTLYPTTLSTENNQLVVGGVAMTALAKSHGTPLYIMDSETVRKNCRDYTQILKDVYPNHLVCYAGKANSNTGLLQVIRQEGLGVDVVSAGELMTALAAGFDPQTILFHGNNKSKTELQLAIKHQVTIVIDNPQEIKNLTELLSTTQAIVPCLVRLKPEIDAHTHTYIRTGQLDSKFGISKDELSALIQSIEAHPHLRFDGIHSHIGSQIFELKPYLEAVDVLVSTMASIQKDLGVEINTLNMGGGFGIQYIKEENPLEIPTVLETLADALLSSCEREGIRPPKLILEPGRSIVGNAGMTLYEIGTLKSIPNIKNYLFIDGGMADNPRPILYQSQYTWALANKADDAPVTSYAIAGKFCESGDILAENVLLPTVEVGDLLCAFGTGAYNYSMASNYNRFCRPEMIAVEKGQTTVWVRRETTDDLLQYDSPAT